MQYYISIRFNLILLLTIIFFSNCGGYKFQQISTTQSLSTIATTRVNSITPVSQVIVLKDFPTDRKYMIMGKCYGSSYRGAWTNVDGSYSAFKRLKKCACSNGGNAIVMTDKEEVIDPFENTTMPSRADPGTPFILSQGAKQVKVKITGYVIYMQPQVKGE